MLVVFSNLFVGLVCLSVCLSGWSVCLAGLFVCPYPNSYLHWRRFIDIVRFWLSKILPVILARIRCTAYHRIFCNSYQIAHHREFTISSSTIPLMAANRRRKKVVNAEREKERESREVNITWSPRETSEKGCFGILYMAWIWAQAILNAKLYSSEVFSSHS